MSGSRVVNSSFSFLVVLFTRGFFNIHTPLVYSITSSAMIGYTIIVGDTIPKVLDQAGAGKKSTGIALMSK